MPRLWRRPPSLPARRYSQLDAAQWQSLRLWRRPPSLSPNRCARLDSGRIVSRYALVHTSTGTHTKEKSNSKVRKMMRRCITCVPTSALTRTPKEKEHAPAHPCHGRRKENGTMGSEKWAHTQTHTGTCTGGGLRGGTGGGWGAGRDAWRPRCGLQATHRRATRQGEGGWERGGVRGVRARKARAGQACGSGARTLYANDARSRSSMLPLCKCGYVCRKYPIIIINIM